MGTVAAFYVSELSHAKYRPAFSGLLMLYASLGILIVSVLQIFFTWQQTALFCCIFFTIILVLCIYYLPESPVWLAKFRSDLVGAKRTLRSLISNDEVSKWSSSKKYENVYALFATGCNQNCKLVSCLGHLGKLCICSAFMLRETKMSQGCDKWWEEISVFI